MSKAYSINEVAGIFSITTNKLRFYENKGLITPKRDSINNYRFYTEDDLVKIQTILMYRVLDLPLDNIKNMLDMNYKNNILDHFHRQWEVLNDEIHRLRLMRDSTEKIMDAIYDSSDENYVDKIIESASEINQLMKIKDNWQDRWNFDDWAKTYDMSVEKDLGELKIYKNYNEILQTVFEKSIIGFGKDEHSTKILDIGVGTGNLSEKYLVEGYDITGIDQSRKMMNVAKQKFPKLKVRLGEFLNIPYDKNEFDIIVSTYAFHHLNDKEKELAIKEMIRVLKEEGRIVIGDLMFANNGDKEAILARLTDAQILEIKDEYYSDIEKLEMEFKKYNKNLVNYRVDDLNYVIVVQ